MAQSKAFYSVASSFLVKSGAGTVYGYHIGDPAAGGTVAVADLLNVGAVPNLGIPSTFGPGLIAHTKFPASPQPLTVDLHGRSFTDGLSVSISSTQSVTVFYD